MSWALLTRAWPGCQNGNLLLMVRIAEALSEPVKDGYIRTIRWENGIYVIDAYALDEVETDDPRKFTVKRYLPNVVTALTSLVLVASCGDFS